MKLSNTSQYALRILCFMAKEPGKRYSAKYLVEKLKISDKYLRRLMTDLSKAGFIRSIQGREGGYVFNRETRSIILADIINAVEGLDKYMGCLLGFEQCSDENPCALHHVWVKIREDYSALFNSMSLADLNLNEINKF